MAIRTVVTQGFGNGTFNGTIALVTLRGYIVGAAFVFEPGVIFPVPTGNVTFVTRSGTILFTPNNLDFEFKPR